MVAVTGVVPALVAVKDPILPVPLAARPMEVVLFVQLYEVALPEKVIAVVDCPLQTVWLVTGFTVGVGFTAIVKLVGVPVQFTPPLL